MKHFRGTAWLTVLLLLFTTPAMAYTPYQNYTYDYNEKSSIEPQAYIPVRTIGPKELGTSLNEPQDLFIKGDRLYIAVTGHNRILITDLAFQKTEILESFQHEGKTDTFKKPAGVFVTPGNRLYVADTENARLVEFDEQLRFVRVIGRPQTPLLTDSATYRPRRVSVDNAGRMFVVSENMSSGMIELDHEGNFVGFFGAVKTQPDLWKILWRFFATEEQKKRTPLVIPTEYSSNDIDDKGFVYGTVGIIDPKDFSDTMFIHRLNPIGDDILRRYGSVAPMGDAEYTIDKETNLFLPSMLTDICVQDSGIYTVLDRRLGRVFTYDFNGQLLYVFGALGHSLGQFKLPTAIDSFDDSFAVLDSELAQIVVFQPTEYGRLITSAVKSAYAREYDAACEDWLQTLKYTSKSELSYCGVGDAMFNKGDYAQAMRYYRLGNSRKYYSAAFEQYRIWFMDRYFMLLIGGAAVILALLVGVHIYRKKRRSARKEG